MTQQQNNLGMAPHIAAALCYVLPGITSTILLFLENENKEIRFHAWQGTLLGACFLVGLIVLKIVGGITGLIVAFVGVLIAGLGGQLWGIAFLIFWGVGLVKAYQGERWRIPVLGDIAAHKSGLSS